MQIQIVSLKESTTILAKQAVSAGVIIKDQVTSVGMYGQGMKGLFERTK